MLSTQPVLLPPIPQPPHDPTSWLLNGRAGSRANSREGWHAAKLHQIEILPPQQSLTLALAPESRRSPFEPNGSFGGFITPANVALGPDGSLYLLDTEKAQLKRFDPCECTFQVVPCFGGTGSRPRELSKANGIGICLGNLFVCDPGNHRVSVFALHGFVLRGYLQPPASAYQGPNPLLENNWEPFDLAFDRYGRVYVTDPANGCVHRFSASGQWQTRFSGLGPVRWITIDCRNNIFVVAEGGPSTLRLLHQDGSSVPVVSTPEELAPWFPRLPFSVDAEGLLHLGSLCADNGPGRCDEPPSPVKCPPNQTVERGLFDQLGNGVIRCASPSSLSYVTAGSYFSEALDSELYRCQWHRVILRGEIPPGASVVVFTYAAEALLTNDQVLNLGDEWETNQTASEVTKGEWDCLVRSGGGRFLWLRLEFFGNGKVTPRLDSVEIEFPRISLRRYLPAVFGEETSSADFTDRFLSLFDTTLRSVETKLDQQARFYDPLSTPAQRDPKTGIDFLSWLASWIGVSLDRTWPEAKRRSFLKKAGSLFDLRGTREGLWRELLLFLDMETSHCCCEGPARTRCRPTPANCAPKIPEPCSWEPPPLILEHFKLRRWLFLGGGRIGDQAVLWGKRIVNRSQLNDGAQVGKTKLVSTQDPYRDPFHYYAHKFTVFVPACYRKSEAHRKSLENLLRAGRPATALAQIEYVEPRFRIGFQSMIGFDSVIGRYPAGVTLDQTPLGRASVLTTPPHKQGGPSLEIGNQSRIGATTKLE
jgi:phage tail-like protein